MGSHFEALDALIFMVPSVLPCIFLISKVALWNDVGSPSGPRVTDSETIMLFDWKIALVKFITWIGSHYI